MSPDRDRAVVAWVAVIGAVSAQDVMARFAGGRTVGYRRLLALVDHASRNAATAPRTGAVPEAAVAAAAANGALEHRGRRVRDRGCRYTGQRA